MLLAVEIISAVATVVIGIAALSIARSQTRAALFDRRFAAFRDLAAGMAQMAIDGAVYDPTFEKLKEAILLSRFLFNKEVVQHLDRLVEETQSAWMLRPLKNRGRDAADWEKAEQHHRNMEEAWREARPLIERALNTWGR